MGFSPKNGELMVGERAFNMLEMYPANFVSEIKRKMGEAYTVQLGEKNLKPEEVAALILRELKEFAEEYLGEEVDRAVITVPANFNDRQRSATKIAGELAGLTVERIINEPTAAALALGNHTPNAGHMMVYDLGGGTFDVTILELVDGVLDVKASAGDNQLGGKDFDELLFEHIVNQFEQQNNIDLRSDVRSKWRVLRAAEIAKKDLSVNLQTSVFESFVASVGGNPINLEVDVSRSEFEALIEPLLDRTVMSIDKALRDAKLTRKDIDQILLVGGSTRIPKVRELIANLMNREPILSVDPDKAIALGAAIQASVIEGTTDTVIMDVCPLSLGTAVVDIIDGIPTPGVYSEILPSNTPLLKKCTNKYFTINDQQESMDLQVFQKDSLSNSIWTKDHTLLYKTTIGDIPLGAAGEQSMTVTYVYNQNGMLGVEAVVDSTGTLHEFSVETTMRQNTAYQDLEEIWKQSKYAVNVKSTVEVAEKRLCEIGGNDVLNEKVLQLKQAIANGNEQEIEILDDEINDILLDLEG